MMPLQPRNHSGDGNVTGPGTVVPAVASRPGWSVFLCDSAGNVVDHAGTTSGPAPADYDLPVLKDLPPGRRLLFIRP